MKPIDPKTLLENLYSLFITWVAWAIPLSIFAIVTRDIQGSDLKFTRLIQNCFRDFGVISDRRGVEIYHYVGDGVVVSGMIDKGLKDQNILRLFFDFREQLQLNWEKYQHKFGVKPVFKAGAHMGDVTVAEIGLAKRGIEYLSDVLNTAARHPGNVQSLCRRSANFRSFKGKTN